MEQQIGGDVIVRVETEGFEHAPPDPWVISSVVRVRLDGNSVASCWRADQGEAAQSPGVALSARAAADGYLSATVRRHRGLPMDYESWRGGRAPAMSGG